MAALPRCHPRDNLPAGISLDRSSWYTPRSDSASIGTYICAHEKWARDSRLPARHCQTHAENNGYCIGRKEVLGRREVYNCRPFLCQLGFDSRRVDEGRRGGSYNGTTREIVSELGSVAQESDCKTSSSKDGQDVWGSQYQGMRVLQY